MDTLTEDPFGGDDVDANGNVCTVSSIRHYSCARDRTPLRLADLGRPKVQIVPDVERSAGIWENLYLYTLNVEEAEKMEKAENADIPSLF